MKGDLLEEVAFAWANLGKLTGRRESSTRANRWRWENTACTETKTVNMELCAVGEAPRESLGCSRAPVFRGVSGLVVKLLEPQATWDYRQGSPVAQLLLPLNAHSSKRWGMSPWKELKRRWPTTWNT